MGNNILNELNHVARSRGWKTIGQITDVKSATLALLKQTVDDKIAIKKIDAVQTLIKKLTSHLDKENRSFYIEQLTEDVFYLLAFSKKQDKEYTRKLRSAGKTFLKLNETTAQVAFLETLQDLYKETKTKISKDALLREVLKNFDEITETLNLKELDEESLEKSIRLSLKNSERINGVNYYSYISANTSKQRGKRRTSLLPDRI